MPNLGEIVEQLRQLAPVDLAEDWDNTGLLVGDHQQAVNSIMTCLTLTPDVAVEAVSEGVSLVVAHHPVMFRPIQRLTPDTVEGAMLLDLIRHGTAVYSPHTAWDSSPEGINQQLAESLELSDIQPLRPLDDTPGSDCTAGSGRWGHLAEPATLRTVAERVRDKLGMRHMQFVGASDLEVSSLGVACGAAAEFLKDARAAGCQALLTGEARFHDCLEARSRNTGLILPGHYMTERPAMENLAKVLGRRFPNLRVWASTVETDPVQVL